jgi:hypothetical protein
VLIAVSAGSLGREILPRSWIVLGLMLAATVLALIPAFAEEAAGDTEEADLFWQAADEEAADAEEAGFEQLEGDWAQSEDEWQVLPAGLLYKSYLAGEKEPRFQAVWLWEKHRGLVWETSLGGRVGAIRYGSFDTINPQGWQLDLEGAALPRVDPQQQDNLEAVDFRIGILSTWRRGPNAFKAGYYHLSSHVGDEFLLANPGFVRLNYVRDSGIVGWTRDVHPDAQVYGEVAYAFNHEDGALPLELQFGVQYSPLSETGLHGAPFGGINGHVREDFDYETSVNVVAGWQWRGFQSNHLFRVGMQYYEGPALQYSFVNKHESLLGGGMWFDY